MPNDERRSMLDQFALVGKALGSGKRLELIDLIAQRERTVGTLAELTGMGVSTTSAHLQVLKRARLVVTRRVETSIYYALAGNDVASLYVLLQKVGHSHIVDGERARSHPGAGADSDVEELSREELLARARSGSVVVLDVRPWDEFAAGHIPGAVSIPLAELELRLPELPPDVRVVAYCRNEHCVLAPLALRLLHASGREATRLDYGMIEWRLWDEPVQSIPEQRDEVAPPR